MNMLNNLTIRTRLVFVIAFLAVELITGAAIGIYNLGTANDRIESIYQDRLVALGQLDKVVRLLNLNQLGVATAISATDAEVPRLMNEIDANIDQITATWKSFRETGMTPDEQRLAEQFERARQAFEIGRAHV